MASGTQSYDIGSESDTGLRRRENQDAYGRADSGPHEQPRERRERYGRLFVVADGVGGNADGKEASELVVARVMAHFYAGQHPADDPHQGLRLAIERANTELHQEAASRRSNMASTLVAALIFRSRLIVANVGDSVALLLREQQTPEQLSESHVTSVAGRSMLSQAMGHPEVAISFQTRDLQPGDIVVLASDGLTNQVSLEQIQSICRRFDGSTAAKKLVQLANQRGGPDNITALVIGNRPRPARSSRFNRVALLIAVIAVIVLTALWLVRSNLLSILSVPTTAPTVMLPSPPTILAVDGTPTVPAGPTPTLVPEPSNTPTPTDTPTPTPTNTPRPIPPTPRPPTATPLSITETVAVETTTASPEASPETPPVPTISLAPTRSFRAQLVQTFPDTGSSGLGQSCVIGLVRDRNGNGISGAVVYVNNGAYTSPETPTDQNGGYKICDLGYSEWSVVLTYIPGPVALTRQAVGRTFLNGSPDQRAIIDFVER